MIRTIGIGLLTLLFLRVNAGTCQTTWDFEYEEDSFSDDALLDLRYLNEAYAGEHGFIKCSMDGNSFVDEDGKEIRFWAVNGGSLARRMSDDDLAYFARFLSKMGVNMIRYHGSINPKGEFSDLFDVDTLEVMNIWRLVAAMKKEGIYSTISPFWAHNGHMGGIVPEKWGIDGYSDEDPLWAVMYFNERLKSAYKHWVKYLYTTYNPYTGGELKNEPAVALIQIKNEDSIFFWTMNFIKPELKQLIRETFSEWLILKYGNLNEAFRKWKNYKIVGDNPENGLVELIDIYHLTIDKQDGEALRIDDQTEFYMDTQYNFYKEIYEYYKIDLGCGQLINANNWKTANAMKLLDIERYTYTACDVIAANRYYDPRHEGENNGWRIDPGHYYSSISCLNNPAEFPINMKQVDGYPNIMTESGWNFPQKYMSEAPFLIAAYQSLTGVDAFYWFALSARDYDRNPYFTFAELPDRQFPMKRWTCSIPSGLGLFPANALMYRSGDIRKGQPVISERRKLVELYKRKTPAITEESGFDPNRDMIALGTDQRTGRSPLCYLAGPVTVGYATDLSGVRIDRKNDENINCESGKIKSSTRELVWDYKKGICTINTECAKGVAGFLDSSDCYDLDGVKVRSKNAYAAVNIVSMDEKPLTASEKIFIQVGTQYQPKNWNEEPARYSHQDRMIDGYKILGTGSMPWQCVNTEVEIEIIHPGIQRAFLLNSTFYAVREIEFEKKENSIKIKLPENAIYVILKSN